MVTEFPLDEMRVLEEMCDALDGLDEPARIRCLNYLRAKFVPNGNLPESTGWSWRQGQPLPAVGGGVIPQTGTTWIGSTIPTVAAFC